MTDKKINEAVARKLGWTPNPDHQRKNERAWLDVNGLNQHLPDYVGDIQAAWEVVEKLFQEGMCVQINIAGNEKEVGCNIGDKHQQKAFGYSESAPMAICLAFLKLEQPLGSR